MFTELLVLALFCLSLFLMYVWPVMRHFLKYRKERELLEKKFNRLWKSRNDLLVSVTHHHYNQVTKYIFEERKHFVQLLNFVCLSFLEL